MVLTVARKYTLLFLCLLWSLGMQAQPAVTNNEAAIKQFLERASEEFDSTAPKLEELFDKGVAYQEQKDFSRAKDRFNEFLNLLKEHLKIACVILTQEDQQSYLEPYLSWVEHIKHCGVFYAREDPSWGDLVYDCELFSKSLFLESTNRLKFAVLKSGDEKLINLWKLHEEFKSDYSTYKSYVAILEADSTYLAAKKAFDQGVDHPLTDEILQVEKAAQTMAKYKDALKSIEEDLNLMVAVTHGPQTNFTTSWRDIRNSLAGKQAAVEFISHHFAHTPQQIQYSAIITRKGSQNPVIVHLTNEEQLSRLLERWPHDFDSLYHMIWEPVEENLHGINELFIAAGGAMSRISFAALRHDGRYLSECGAIHNVISTKDIIALRDKTDNPLPGYGSAIFLGGADFGTLPGAAATETKSRGQGFDYLPASKREVTFSSMDMKSKGWSVSLFTDESASEGQLKESLSSASPTILHIATHGFNLPRPDPMVFDMKMSDIGSVDKAVFRFSPNPLMRCGLLFSGANHVWQGREAIEGIDDGIVTGMELSQLNLLGCELVIISACYTALGYIDHTEGVYGLQRALRMAGAGKMVLSLWDIPDKESAEFIRMLYSFLNADIPVVRAFRATQQTMRHLYPDEPQKWAGFVMIDN